MSYKLVSGVHHGSNCPQVLIQELRNGHYSESCGKGYGCNARLCCAMTTKFSRFVVYQTIDDRAIVDHSALVFPKCLRMKFSPEEVSLLKRWQHAWRSSELSEALVEEQANMGNDTDEAEGELDAIQRESLQFLEWSSVCEQLARFTSTSMGVEVAKSGNIPYGKTQEDSEELLAETAAACMLPSPLDFSGIVDVREILRSAVSGSVCNVNELCIIQKTLSSTRRLYEQLENSVSTDPLSATQSASTRIQEENAYFSPLVSIMAGQNFCTSLEQELKEALDSSSLEILDSASLKLANTRKSRRQNMSALEALLQETGEKVVAAGGMDSVVITTRRARLCIAVRASHRYLVPGGVVLDLSNTGATLFMEPKPAIELNNNEVQLASAEKAQELAILEDLTRKLANVAEDIWIMLENVAFLDLACARAGHAQWLGSAKPVFCTMKILSSSGNDHNRRSHEAIDHFSVDIEGLCHPLLLGRALSDGRKDGTSGLPVPVDFKIGSGVTVVVISGPNTGGKTASMKTLGVAALMAKAGLFIPAKGKAIIPWFDQVLADIGDSQSLEQSLSTFSGHIQRVCRIIRGGSKRSLVLLDEIGSGTDPSEGAALATAILQHMACHMCLTVVTTHFAELSRLKEKDKRFEVASLEFDIKTLRPRYNVIWGTAGKSNALDIANSLGIDPSILVRAQHWMEKLAPEKHEERINQLMNPLMEQRKILQSQAEAAALTLSNTMKLHDELLSEADGLEKRVAALRLQQEENVKRELSAIKSHMDDIISSFERSSTSFDEDGKSTSMRDAHSAIASVVESYMKKFSESQMVHANMQTTERPSVGDLVLIKRLGKKLATVIEMPGDGDDNLLVQFGSLKVRVKLSEVAKIVKQQKNPGSHQRSKGRGAQTAPSESVELVFDAAIQTSRNTVDLRGMHVDDGLVELDLAIRKRKPMSVLFVIHGEGTGVLKEAVLAKLNNHPLVAKFEQESPMNFGCTIVYIR